jgi:DNA-binding response OmpR family regulator
MIDVKFLVVDDSRSMRSAVRCSIESRLGCKNVIYEAEDGLKALEILKKNPVDIIISDWNMPNMTGEQFLIEVRSNPDWKNIPFLMITSEGSVEHVISAKHSGVSQYIVKPFTANELEEKIRKSWDGSVKRTERRHSKLPPHALSLRMNGKNHKSELIDISTSGALLHLDYDDFKLFEECELFLQADKTEAFDTLMIWPLAANITRLESDATPEAPKRCQLAIIFIAEKIKDKVMSKLEVLLKYSHEKEPREIGS